MEHMQQQLDQRTANEAMLSAMLPSGPTPTVRAPLPLPAPTSITPTLLELNRPSSGAGAQAHIVPRERAVLAYEAAVAQGREWMTVPIPPFHGEPGKDVTHKALDWVRHVSVEFGLVWRGTESGQVAAVRQQLRGKALMWMDNRTREWNEQLSRGEVSGTLKWRDMEDSFIADFLKGSTVQKARGDLEALRLGSARCPTPHELNQHFDHLTGMLTEYSRVRADGRPPQLVEEYSRIVAASNIQMYRHIALTRIPDTIHEWKKELTGAWCADLKYTAMTGRSLFSLFPQDCSQPCQRQRRRGRRAGRGHQQQ